MEFNGKTSGSVPAGMVNGNGRNVGTYKFNVLYGNRSISSQKQFFLTPTLYCILTPTVNAKCLIIEARLRNLKRDHWRADVTSFTPMACIYLKMFIVIFYSMPVKNMALGPQLRQKPRPMASVFVYLSPSGHVFNIAWQAVIKTYNTIHQTKVYA